LENLGSLAGLCGLDASDWLGGRPPESAGAAAEVDGDGTGGDVDGDDLAGVDAPEGDLLHGDHDDSGVAGPPLGGGRLSGAISPWSVILPGRKRGTHMGLARATWVLPVK
jgi:hypothetical protein